LSATKHCFGGRKKKEEEYNSNTCIYSLFTNSKPKRIMEDNNKGRKVVVSALQFACTDDVSTNVATADRFPFISIKYHFCSKFNLFFVIIKTHIFNFINFLL
jgi:hypothetical protein